MAKEKEGGGKGGRQGKEGSEKRKAKNTPKINFLFMVLASMVFDMP